MNWKFRKVYLGISCFLASFSLVAQNKESNEVLQMVSDFYQSTHVYTITMKYDVYKNDNEIKPVESYSGIYLKINKYSKLTLLNSEVIQAADTQLIIDHTNKAISYNRALEETQVINTLDFKNYLKFYETSCVEEQQGKKVLHLQLKNNATPMPYYKVILHIDQKEHFVTKQELFFSRKLPFESSDGKKEWGRAKLCIEMELQKSVDQEISQISDYVIPNPDGHKQLTGKYKNYQLVDLTK
ncbi:hypothetical protein [uncultured Aquimarina sp.]|uniref:LolA family protein n=1 Tax=uncultured Aquimarina sp. TaxID=575652 RepID=UPI002628ADEA|nr:hypothetical protein [uncultured Aquimarina sp.]